MPMCAKPRAPPPPSTSPVARPPTRRANRARSRSSPSRTWWCVAHGARSEPARGPGGTRRRVVVHEHQLDAGRARGGAHRGLGLAGRGIVARACDEEHAVGLAQAPSRPRRPRRVRLEHDVAVPALLRRRATRRRLVPRIAVAGLRDAGPSERCGRRHRPSRARPSPLHRATPRAAAPTSRAVPPGPPAPGRS